MPDPRTCAVCGSKIIWYEGANGGIVALNPEAHAEGLYALVSGLACFVDLLGEKRSEMLGGLRYMDHALTCKPKAS